jgi:hypothetical protein
MFFDITSQLLFGADALIGFLIVGRRRRRGTSIAFLNTTDKSSGTNPAWVLLDAAEEHPLEAESANGSAETFIMYAAVGTVVRQKTITQGAL